MSSASSVAPVSIDTINDDESSRPSAPVRQHRSPTNADDAPVGGMDAAEASKLLFLHDSLACCKCHERFTTKQVNAQAWRLPLLLLCGHSFCRECVDGLESVPLDAKGASAYITDDADELPDRLLMCGECRQYTPLGPRRGVEGIPLNEMLLAALEHPLISGRSDNSNNSNNNTTADPSSPAAAAAAAAEEEAGTKCEECEVALATEFCEQCEASYCDACAAKTHSSRVMKRHARRPLQDDNTGDNDGDNGERGDGGGNHNKNKKKEGAALFGMCDEHKEPLSLFCLTDEDPICPLCKDFGNHVGHQIMDTSEVVADAQGRIRSGMDVLAVVHARLRNASESLSSAVSAVELVADEVANVVEEQFVLLERQLADRRAALLREVSSLKTDKIRTLMSQRYQSAQAMARIQAMFEQGKRVVHASDLRVLMHHKRDVLRNIQRTQLLATAFSASPVVTPRIWPRFPANMSQVIDNYGFVSGQAPPLIKGCMPGPTWITLEWTVHAETVSVAAGAGGDGDDGRPARAQSIHVAPPIRYVLQMSDEDADDEDDADEKDDGMLAALVNADFLDPALKPYALLDVDVHSSLREPKAVGSGGGGGGEGLDAAADGGGGGAAAGGGLSSSPGRGVGSMDRRNDRMSMEVYKPEVQMNDEHMRTAYEGPELMVTVPNLLADRRYAFRVQAVYKDGKGPWSPIRMFSTQDTEPTFKMEFKYSGAVQKYTIPSTGTFRVVVRGASAADGEYRRGGAGAVVSADFNLSLEDHLDILCGGASARDNTRPDTGGGGGTYISVNGRDSALVVAGGGGGTRGTPDFAYHGRDASLSPSGTSGVSDGAAFGAGGTDGKAGTPPADSSHGGAGGGFRGPPGRSWHGADAYSFGEGGAAGKGGGFGGGGARGKFGGGGGGGYSGGGGGWGGGGGGSYVREDGTNVSMRTGHRGHGSVTLMFLGY